MKRYFNMFAAAESLSAYLKSNPGIDNVQVSWENVPIYHFFLDDLASRNPFRSVYQTNKARFLFKDDRAKIVGAADMELEFVSEYRRPGRETYRLTDLHSPEHAQLVKELLLCASRFAIRGAEIRLLLIPEVNHIAVWIANKVDKYDVSDRNDHFVGMEDDCIKIYNKSSFVGFLRQEQAAKKANKNAAYVPL